MHDQIIVDQGAKKQIDNLHVLQRIKVYGFATLTQTLCNVSLLEHVLMAETSLIHSLNYSEFLSLETTVEICLWQKFSPCSVHFESLTSSFLSNLHPV